MKKIKIAQIGTSAYSHGSQIFASLKKQSEIFDVVGFAFPENEIKKFPDRMWAFDGMREMTVDQILSDPEIEAVSIETEEIYLTKYALAAAEHKKHIHMEKPGGIDLDKFERVIETAKRNKTVFHTGYMYRYNPAVKELIKKCREGVLGEIVSIEAQMNWCHPIIDRQWLKNFPGGIMFFLGGHLVDFVLQIMGMPDRVAPFNACTGKDGITSEDFGMAVLCYEKGNSIVKTAANEIGGRRFLVVSGTRGTAIIDPVEGGGSESALKAKMIETLTGASPEKNEWTTDEFDRYDSMLESFGKMVRGEIENPYSYEYELNLYKTLLKCCGK